MVTDSRPRPSRQREILNELIRQHGLPTESYALFFVVGEGKYLPSSSPWRDIEEASGYVLDCHGRIFAFWLGWDTQLAAPGFTDWEQVSPEPHWAAVPEYRRACAQLGLDPTNLERPATSG